jgi:sugar phosphate isomerase/epimerase
MKLSFALSLQRTSFDYIINNDGWRKKLRLLKQTGYQGVELGIRNPQILNPYALEKVLNRYKLQLSAIGTGQAYIDDGLSLSSLKSDIRNQAINRIKKHIDLAAIFGAQVIIGLVRGRLEQKDTKARQIKHLIEGSRRICDYACPKSVIVTVEPLNRYETSFLNNTKETLSFIKKIKSNNLKILLDTFHMNIEEDNLKEPLQKGIRYLSHIHLADNNRKCPGEGAINFNYVMNQLKQLGYQGYLSGEMLTQPTAEHCIRKFYRMFKPYIK